MLGKPARCPILLTFLLLESAIFLQLDLNIWPKNKQSIDRCIIKPTICYRKYVINI